MEQLQPSSSSATSQRDTLCLIQSFILQLNRYEDTSTSLALMKLIRKKYPKEAQQEVNKMEHRSSKTWTLPELLDGLNEIIEEYEKCDAIFQPNSLRNSTSLLFPLLAPDLHYWSHVTIQGRVVSVTRLTIALLAIITCLWKVVALSLMLFDYVGSAFVTDTPAPSTIILIALLVEGNITICFVRIQPDEATEHPRQEEVTIHRPHSISKSSSRIYGRSPSYDNNERERHQGRDTPVYVAANLDEEYEDLIRHLKDPSDTQVCTALDHSTSSSIMTVESLAVDHQTNTSTSMLDTGLSHHPSYYRYIRRNTYHEGRQFLQFNNIRLESLTISRAVTPDILIGIDYFWDIVTSDCPQTLSTSLVLCNTLFGPTISGSKFFRGCLQQFSTNPISLSSDEADPVSRFDRLDVIGTADDPDLSSDQEEYARIPRQFQDTALEIGGHLYIRFPWKSTPIYTIPRLADNKLLALKRLESQYKSFVTKPDLWRLYASTIDDYLDKGIIEGVDEHHFDNHRVYYSPHQSVIEESSTTTKLRVGFDA
ncbi:unnamed protein product [Haemonchus placei]|uniref:DUF1758 domain-containing protein n=1 Tax=Haemonchus placei TaxID=6290 RepID=A0A0N4WPS3_HAEPC|nr:unnamed protein product [Haemonchus placei]